MHDPIYIKFYFKRIVVIYIENITDDEIHNYVYILITPKDPNKMIAYYVAYNILLHFLYTNEKYVSFVYTW